MHLCSTLCCKATTACLFFAQMHSIKALTNSRRCGVLSIPGKSIVAIGNWFSRALQIFHWCHCHCCHHNHSHRHHCHLFQRQILQMVCVTDDQCPFLDSGMWIEHHSSDIASLKLFRGNHPHLPDLVTGAAFPCNPYRMNSSKMHMQAAFRFELSITIDVNKAIKDDNCQFLLIAQVWVQLAEVRR